MSDSLTVETIFLPDQARRWFLVDEFLALREAVFVEEMRWPLETFEGREFDQYDTLDATYCIAHRNGVVEGGLRLIRTDFAGRETGGIKYTYMIRDAALGILPGLPLDICREQPPADPHVWELTRLASRGGTEAGRMVLKEAYRYLASIGATECLCLSSPVVMRLAKVLGYRPRPLGAITGNRDGRFLAFSCEVRGE